MIVRSLIGATAGKLVDAPLRMGQARCIAGTAVPVSEDELRAAVEADEEIGQEGYLAPRGQAFVAAGHSVEQSLSGGWLAYGSGHQLLNGGRPFATAAEARSFVNDYSQRTWYRPADQVDAQVQALVLAARKRLSVWLADHPEPVEPVE